MTYQKDRESKIFHILQRIIVTTCLGIMVAGCDNGFNCPIDPPSCCYNQVFGCGLFDLPAGCSCSDFFSFPLVPKRLLGKQLAEPQKYHKSKKTPGISGSWSGDLGRVRNTCSVTLSQVSGAITVKRVGDNLEVQVPNYGTLIGRSSGALSTVRGTYRQAGCQANVGASIRNVRTGRARAVVNTQLTCKSGVNCRAQFKGDLAKLR